MQKEGVILKKGKEKIVQQRHHWIFSGAIDSFPKNFVNGEILPFFSSEGKLLGHAYFNQSCSLCGRIVSFGDIPPKEAILQSIQEAFTLRKTLFSDENSDDKTNAYRLIQAEGDHLPGLIVDRYGDYLVLQIGTLGMEKQKPYLLSILSSLFPIKGIYEKSTAPSRKEEHLTPYEEILWGDVPDHVEILEEGLKFLVSIKKGQKTGFFLDQREMRNLIGSLSSGKRVLNCFSYTGGFTVAALKNHATSVDSIDSSQDALEMGKKNVLLNGLPLEKSPFIQGDVFSFLKEKSALPYDIVILDPPAFAKKKGEIEGALKGYKEINYQAMSKMEENTFLLTCSCSYHVDDTLFRTCLFEAAKKARREVKILSAHRMSLDHPINLYHRESDYLKGYLLYIGKKYV